VSDTAAQRLEAIRTAIDKVIASGVAEYEMADGTTVTYHDLESLQKLESYWAKRASTEAGTRHRVMLADIGGSDSC